MIFNYFCVCVFFLFYFIQLKSFNCNFIYYHHRIVNGEKKGGSHKKITIYLHLLCRAIQIF